MVQPSLLNTSSSLSDDVMKRPISPGSLTGTPRIKNEESIYFQCIIRKFSRYPTVLIIMALVFSQSQAFSPLTTSSSTQYHHESLLRIRQGGDDYILILNARKKNKARGFGKTNNKSKDSCSSVLPPQTSSSSVSAISRSKAKDVSNKTNNESQEDSSILPPLPSLLSESQKNPKTKTKNGNGNNKNKHTVQSQKSKTNTTTTSVNYKNKSKRKKHNIVMGDKIAPSVYNNSHLPPTTNPSSNSSTFEQAVPVSELTYKSSSSSNTASSTTNIQSSTQQKDKHNSRNRAKFKASQNDPEPEEDEEDDDDDDIDAGYNDHDDEELPFSAEQTNRIYSTGNKIQIRRNKSPPLNPPQRNKKRTNTSVRNHTSNLTTSQKKKQNNQLQNQNKNNIDQNSKKESNAKYFFRKERFDQMNSRKKLNSSSFSNNTNYNKKKWNNVSNKSSFGKRTRTRSPNKKMVRRGMEMLVGGEPVNADPPVRFLELMYNPDKLMSPGDNEDINKDDVIEEKSVQNLDIKWNNAIALNSRDFGPLLHAQSQSKVNTKSIELYCEFFVSHSLKWDICPPDLRSIVQENIHLVSSSSSSSSQSPTKSYNELVKKVIKDTKSSSEREKNNSNNSNFSSKLLSKADGNNQQNKKAETEEYEDLLKKIENKIKPAHYGNELEGGELKFTVGVGRSELLLQSMSEDDEEEDGGDKSRGIYILRGIMGRGISKTIKCRDLGYYVSIDRLVLSEELDDSTGLLMTEVSVGFHLVRLFRTKKRVSNQNYNHIANQINQALSEAVNGGGMAMALANSVKREQRWPDELKDQVIEELMFDSDEDEEEPILRLEDEDESEEDEYDDENEEQGDTASLYTSLTGYTSTTEQPSWYDDLDLNNNGNGPFGSQNYGYKQGDIFLGGGNGGVFHNYSSENEEKAPYRGILGPLLVDGVAKKAVESGRVPRIIAIGDVHGCIDELQALLKKCDYRPGDIVVFLGDLVSKGPDSLAVVQMAREIGAIGVRGNHDFEVIRWHQAITSGACISYFIVMYSLYFNFHSKTHLLFLPLSECTMKGADTPVVGSEHFRIASKLSKADLKWLYSLPWYITSKELNALFVHAGFVSGIRLAKQNPRLMMNMRSILPDGTVTSKFFNNWPWARLWDGPQTVFFGHDADRGLQQYEHAIGLDTGCVYGGRLSACILPEKRLVSVPAKKQYFRYRRKHYD